MASGLLDLLAAEASRTTGTARFRGGVLELRALTAWETERLHALHPRPGAPHVRQPGTHPETGPVMVNDQDPRYLQAMTQWFRRVRALEIAAATGTAAGGMAYAPDLSDERLRAWAAAAQDAVLGKGGASGGGMTDDELMRVWGELRDLADPIGKDGERIEAAKKALSALSRSEAEAVMGECFPTGTA